MSDSLVIVPIPKAFQVPIAVAPGGYRVLEGYGPLRTGDVIRAVGGHSLAGKQAHKRWRQHWRDGAELLVVPTKQPSYSWGKKPMPMPMKPFAGKPKPMPMEMKPFSDLDAPRVPSTPSTCASTPMRSSLDGGHCGKLDLDSSEWNTWWSCQQNGEAYDFLEVEPQLLSPKELLAAAKLLSVAQLEERWPEDLVSAAVHAHTLDTEGWWTNALIAAVELSHTLDLIQHDRLSADAAPFMPAFRFNPRAPVFFPRIIRRSWDHQ